MRNLPLLLVTLLIVLIPTSLFGQQEEIFSDSFETGDSAEWSMTHPQPPVVVEIEPEVVAMDFSEIQEFRARVLNDSDRRVSWSVTGGELVGEGNTVFFVPAESGILSITATSLADPSASATATVTVTHTPRIEFVSDRSVALSVGGSDSQRLEVQVLGSDGQPVPGAQVDWVSNDPGLVSVVSDGPLAATVTAPGSALGSTTISVVSTDPAATAEATVVVADLGDQTILIDSDWVVDRGETTLTLVRNAVTDALQPQDILASGDKAGVLARVLSVSVLTSEVQLDTEIASVTDAFENLEITSEPPPLKGELHLLRDGSGVVLLHTAEGEILSRNILQGVSCEAQDGSSVGLQAEGASVQISFDLTPEAALSVDFFTLELFRLSVRSELGLNATTGSLEFTSQIGGTASCSLELGTFELPGVPIYAFTFRPRVTPVIGVEAGASFDGPSFSFAGPEGSLNATMNAGIQYTNTSGWQSLNDFSVGSSLSLFSQEIDFSSSFEADAGPFARLDASLLVQLGRSFLSVDLADFRFAEVKAGAMLSAQLATPIDPEDPTYAGPSWTIGTNLSGDLVADLSGGLLNDLLEYLDIPTSYDGGLNLFDTANTLLSSPISSTSLEPDPSCMGTPQDLVQEGETVFLTAMLDSEADGNVEFWGSTMGGELELLTQGQVSGGSGMAEWSPTEGQTGVYEIYDRVKVDALSQVLPYTSGTAIEIEVISAEEGTPVITNIDIPSVVIGDGSSVLGTIFFTDLNAGINWLDLTIAWDTCGGCTSGGAWDPGVGDQTSGTIGFYNTCTNNTGVSFSFGVNATLSDCQGNTSDIFSFSITCLSTTNVPEDGGEATALVMPR